MPEQFLISTTHFLLGFDGVDRFYKVDAGRGLYYGMAKYAGRLYVACSSGTQGVHDEQQRAERSGRILCFDHDSLMLLGEFAPDFPVPDLKDIAIFDRKLWACGSSTQIAICDLDTYRWEKWYPAPDLVARDNDVNHFHTLQPTDETHFCIVADHRGSGGLFLFDRETRDLCSVTPLGQDSHDIFMADGSIAACSSGEGVLAGVDGWCLRVGGFPRGVAFGTDSTLVGISLPALRSDTSKSPGVVRQLNRRWEHKADHLLPGVGSVYGLISLGEECDLNQFEDWPDAITTIGQYNTIIPGNKYLSGSGSPSCLRRNEWHYGEEGIRWTAARDAHLEIVCNPGESRLSISAFSAFPGSFHAEVILGTQCLGSIRWDEPGPRHIILSFPNTALGRQLLCFRVPRLWKPQNYLPGGVDERNLGIGVLQIELLG